MEVISEKRREIRGDKRTKEYKSRRDKIEWLMNYHDYHIDMFTEEERSYMYDRTLDRQQLMFRPQIHRWAD